jgi:hypothetical protein
MRSGRSAQRMRWTGRTADNDHGRLAVDGLQFNLAPDSQPRPPRIASASLDVDPPAEQQIVALPQIALAALLIVTWAG